MHTQLDITHKNSEEGLFDFSAERFSPFAGEEKRKWCKLNAIRWGPLGEWPERSDRWTLDPTILCNGPQKSSAKAKKHSHPYKTCLSNKNTVYNCTANESVNKSVLLLPLPWLSVWLGPFGGFSTPQLSRQLKLSDFYLHQKTLAPGKERVLNPGWSASPKVVPMPRPFIYFNHWGWRSFGTTNHEHSYTDMVEGQRRGETLNVCPILAPLLGLSQENGTPVLFTQYCWTSLKLFFQG